MAGNLALPAPTPGAPPPSPPAPFNDVSQDLSDSWQLVDLASRTLDHALTLGGLYQQPEAIAGVRACKADLDRIIAAYAKADPTMGPSVGATVAPPSERDAPGLPEQLG